jgi:hypothetical protein
MQAVFPPSESHVTERMTSMWKALAWRSVLKRDNGRLIWDPSTEKQMQRNYAPTFVACNAFPVCWGISVVVRIDEMNIFP